MYYIYGLFDPRDGQLHYIGRTNDMERRLKQHCKGDSNIRKIAWLKELDRKWLVPLMREIDTAKTLEEIIDLEKFYIYYFRMLGAYLINGHYRG
jgi:predicted GIY-YIG superfamily endonuclease